MPLLNGIFHTAFGRVDINRGAIFDRGQYPPNHKLLSHPDIQKAKAITKAVELNLSKGSAADVVDTIILKRSQWGY